MRAGLIEFIYNDKGEVIAFPTKEEFLGVTIVLNEWNCIPAAEYMLKMVEEFESQNKCFGFQSQADDFVVNIEKYITKSDSWDFDDNGDRYKSYEHKLETIEVIYNIKLWLKLVLSET